MNGLGWRDVQLLEAQRMDARRELRDRALLVGACLGLLLVLCLAGCGS